GRKEAVPAECNVDGSDSDAEKGALDFFHSLDGFLANKFQCNVQRFRTNPAGIRREAAHAFHEALYALADGVVDVEGNENAHRKTISRQLSAFTRSGLDC